MAQDPGEHDTADLARLVEALHPSKEEDERAERFAARLLERPPSVTDDAPMPDMRSDPEHDELVAALAEARKRSWRRDALMAAIGAALGAVAALVITAIT